jgi:threonine dehydrogenase-like Zn-dependent dehydrogenase
LDLVTSGALDPGTIITNVVPFDDAPLAMVEPAVKIVFVQPGNP